MTDEKEEGGRGKQLDPGSPVVHPRAIMMPMPGLSSSWSFVGRRSAGRPHLPRLLVCVRVCVRRACLCCVCT